MVDTHMLSTLISLEISNADSPKKEDKTSVFYTREFRISTGDMRQIFHSMLHDGFDMNPHIFYWVNRLEDPKTKESDIFTLRYGGQTTDSPWKRHTSGLCNKGLKSFMGHFIRVVGMNCPHVLENARIYTVLGISVPGLPKAQVDLDVQEQVLIALFGDCVLNTQLGGKDMIQMI